MIKFCSFVRDKFTVCFKQKIFRMTKRSLPKSSWSRDQSVRFIVSLLMAPLLHRSPASSATSSDSCRAEELDKRDILFNNILVVLLLLFAELLPA